MTNACPKHFRYAAEQATIRRTTDGFSTSYTDLGSRLASSLCGQEFCDDQTGEPIDLDSMYEGGRCSKAYKGTHAEPCEAAIMAWLGTQFPRIMSLVPRRRRGTFLKGFYACLEEQGYSVP